MGWREITPSGGPAPREDYTWTVDGDSGDVAYLFGGRGATVLADLWAYDLAADSWSEVAASGPAARFGHNAAWVDGVGLVIFAGQGERGFFNDLWAFDPSAGAWRLLSAGGAVPVPRYGSCATIGPDGRLWISHGFTSEGALRGQPAFDSCMHVDRREHRSATSPSSAASMAAGGPSGTLTCTRARPMA